MLKSRRKNTLNKIIMLLYYQNKVICFTLTNILPFDGTFIESKKEDVKLRRLKNVSIVNQFQCSLC